MSKTRIQVLIVEDSSVAQMLLVHVLNADPQIHVIGTARNGAEALEFVAHKTPDVILMDIHMPEMDGFEATRRIMESKPIPIVICSASGKIGDAVTSFRLMEAGAVACVEKPVGHDHPNFDEVVAQLRQTIKLMSEVKVVRRWPRRDNVKRPAFPSKRSPAKIEVIGIGASTGGPPVLQTILSALSKDFPVPLLIVQHIAPGFLSGLAEWLNQTTGLKVHIAAHGIQPSAGHVYLAPDDFHLEFHSGGTLALSRAEPENGLRPSVDRLFHSLAETSAARAVGVLLTGMGKDGAKELKEMKDRGATTIVQDRETSVVHGMPGEAIALDAATHILPADRIAGALTMIVERSSNP
jgi:two-component system, chemotaxis family, protein-glutamate methylesterase/glutaminase